MNSFYANNHNQLFHWNTNNKSQQKMNYTLYFLFCYYIILFYKIYFVYQFIHKYCMIFFSLRYLQFHRWLSFAKNCLYNGLLIVETNQSHKLMLTSLLFQFRGCRRKGKYYASYLCWNDLKGKLGSYSYVSKFHLHKYFS